MSEAVKFSERAIHSIIIAIGSNISPSENINKAIENLNLLFPSMRYSSAYISPPVNGPGPDFINVVAEVFSSLSPNELKDEVFSPLENAMGRIRTEDKNAPRTIDIDIIIYNNLVLESDIKLQPHLIVPLVELNPQQDINTFQKIEDISKIFLLEGRITIRKDILNNKL